MYYLIVVIFLINLAIAGILYAQKDYAFPAIGIITGVGLFTLLLGLTFSHMNITITRTYAHVKFGIGLLQRTVALTDLDPQNAVIEDVSLLTGIGYRYTLKGILYNSSLGKAVFIPNKNGGKSFNVGSDHAQEILDAISAAQS